MRTESLENILTTETHVTPIKPHHERPEPIEKPEYVARLQTRLSEARDSAPGRARALRMALAYLRTSSPAWARWALASVLEAESDRDGPFWEGNRRELARIVRELARVV